MHGIHYSHFYIEKGAEAYPDTRRILDAFPGAERISIEDHKEIFNRSRQNFQLQKRAPKAILAVKRPPFQYAAEERVKSFSADRVFYNSIVRNCVYNCDYCFLQGMHPSAYTVFYVNHDDFLHAARTEATNGELYLSISYLTDILAYEKLMGYVRRWHEQLASMPNATIEVRTKSDHYRVIRDLEPSPQLVFVWSLSPTEIAAQYEKGTASFKNRLFSAAAAVRAGHRLRLCFDPVILTADFERLYAEAIDETFRRVPADAVEEVSFGVFRMHRGFLKRIQEARKDSDILFHPFEHDSELGPGGPMTYARPDRDRVRSFMLGRLARYVPASRVSFVHG